METPLKTAVYACLLLGLFVGMGVLSGCDLASAGSTVILNAGSPIPPTVRHRFEYTEDDVTDNGQVEVVSTIDSDDLDAILSENVGATRSDVVSAHVDSVRIEPVSTASLSVAQMYLGTDANGPRIANVEFQADPPAPVVETTPTTVTGAVRSGATKIFAQFTVEDPNSIPAGGSVVRAVVYYRLEVEGV